MACGATRLLPVEDGGNDEITDKEDSKAEHMSWIGIEKNGDCSEPVYEIDGGELVKQAGSNVAPIGEEGGLDVVPNGEREDEPQAALDGEEDDGRDAALEGEGHHNALLDGVREGNPDAVPNAEEEGDPGAAPNVEGEGGPDAMNNEVEENIPDDEDSRDDDPLVVQDPHVVRNPENYPKKGDKIQ